MLTQKLFDSLLYILSIALIGSCIFVNWYFSQESLLYRVIFGVVSFSLALGALYFTSLGRSIFILLKESRVEVRRVVWPTRPDLTQTTMMVMVVVVIISFILWLLDLFLGWFVSFLIS